MHASECLLCLSVLCLEVPCCQYGVYRLTLILLVYSESVGEQSGGKWKAVDSVSVTSSQAVTLEDIARRAGRKTQGRGLTH